MVIIIKKQIKDFLLFINILIVFSSIILILNYKLSFTKEKVIYSNISSEAAIVMDAKTKKILFAKNANSPKLTASICKILTAYTAIKYLNLDNYIIVNEKMVNIEGSRIYLEIGDIVSIETLLYGLILRSGNDAAIGLAMAYSTNINDFVYRMNEIVSSFNLKNSIFENPSGLDGTTNNYSTCYDLAYITSEALKNDVFRKIISTKSYSETLPNGKKLYFHNKHRMIHTDDNVIGGKTGYTKKAGRTLITIFNQNDRELIVITMNAYNDWNLHRMLVQNYDE